MDLRNGNYSPSFLPFTSSSSGVPVRRKFDTMCSYQWSIQNFVRDFYMDLHMRNLEVWMDIWGVMQGNINEAMANAVECSTTVICFLTAKYQQSVNCCLELKYALSKEKPIIFIKVEPKLSLLPWVADVVARSKVKIYNFSMHVNMRAQILN